MILRGFMTRPYGSFVVAILISALFSTTCLGDPIPYSPEGQGTPPRSPPTPPPPPTVAPPPTPVTECPYISGRINWMGWRPIDYYWGSIQTGAMATQVPCVAALAYNIWRSCDWVNNQYEDDCYSIVLAGLVFRDRYSHTGYHANGSYCEFLRGGHNYAGTCGGGWFYLDRNCNVVPRSVVGVLPSSCTFSVSYYESSPISLIFDQSGWNDHETSLTRFPLNPSTPKSWYTWKASEKAPLLVFDPEHTGKISRADQLFGEWTFGGQRVASIANDLMKPHPWKNGYEALATLDENGDDKISGKELLPLALWMDRNRDGISQEGEVRPITELNVTTLYFHPDRTDEETGSIYATRGFERHSDGKVTTGTLVDWYGKASTSPFSFLEQNAGVESAANVAEELITPITAAPQDNGTTGSLQNDKSASGLWEWYLAEDDKEKQSATAGLLLFRDNASTGKIKGISFAEREIVLSGKMVKEQVVGSAYLLEGKRQPSENGNLVFQFKVQTKGKGELSSTATLRSDGTLEGTSVAKYENRSLQYRWIAKRVEKDAPMRKFGGDAKVLP
jgi:hypothetical protein